jgi:uncharacterized repeat protein (TIGR03847 family)
MIQYVDIKEMEIMSADLGLIRLLGADAIGRPGQRRFRLYAQSTSGSVLIWMEKEQLNSLSIAIDHVLAEITEGQVLRTEAQVHEEDITAGMPAEFPHMPDYEFQGGQIRLSFDGSEMQFQLRVIPIEIIQEHSEEPQVILNEDDETSMSFTPNQGQQLARSIMHVVSSGRPVCPLCHAPLEGGPHACVKQNGHVKIIQAIEGKE